MLIYLYFCFYESVCKNIFTLSIKFCFYRLNTVTFRFIGFFRKQTHVVFATRIKNIIMRHVPSAILSAIFLFARSLATCQLVDPCICHSVVFGQHRDGSVLSLIYIVFYTFPGRTFSAREVLKVLEIGIFLLFSRNKIPPKT